MKLHVAGHRGSKGFALPTVLIASVVLLTVLAVSVSATTAARTTLKNQYYAQLAQIAGEAGVAYAQACLQESGNIPTWTNAKPLTPSTDCNGDPRSAPATVEALVVAGGGGGGGNCDTCGGAGGGGGGGRLYDPSLSVGVGSVSVTVGSGGAGGVELPSRTNGSNGTNSVFGSMTAIGGGGGGAQLGTAGLNGGSGGGGSGGSSPAPGAGGNFTAGQGNVGGAGSSSSTVGGGGGGGAGGVGQPGTGTQDGGLGFAYSITGTSLFYSAGGGGGETSTAAPGAGGSGIGGAGANQLANSGNGFSGAANTGGGGGGAAGQPIGGNGGNGGSGVVIVRYPTGSLTAMGGTITTNAGFTIHRFTSSGTFNVTAIQPLFTCPADNRCHVSVDGNVRSSFSVGLPTLDADGRAATIPQNGYVELTRESTGAVWRTYRQPTTQPTVAPGLCSGAATSGLGWTTAVLTTPIAAFPETRAQTIGITSGVINPGALFFRKDISINEPGTYTAQVKGDGRATLYIDGELITRTANASTTNTVDIELAAGCHTIGVIAVNGGNLTSNGSIEFALRKKDAPLPIVVSDRTWRVAAADTVDWRAVNYFQDDIAGWSPARDVAAYNASPWTGGPASWTTITNGNTGARWISTNHSFSGTNYPFNSYAYFRSNEYGAWTFSSPTEVTIAAACDDICIVYLNGNEVLTTSTFGVAGTATFVAPAGPNQISVRLQNTGASNNASGLLFYARETVSNVVIDQSSTEWSAASSWYGTPQTLNSFNTTYRPSPDVVTCNCTSQGTTNRVLNPSFEGSLVNITAAGASVVRSTEQVRSGSFSAKVTATSTGAMRLDIPVTDIEPGVVYRVSGYYYSPVVMGITGRYLDRTGTYMTDGTRTGGGTLNAWARFSRTIVAGPTGAEVLRIEISTSVSQPAGTVYYIDDLMVTQGSALLNYADGGSPGWSWVETPNASPSSGPIL